MTFIKSGISGCLSLETRLRGRWLPEVAAFSPGWGRAWMLARNSRIGPGDAVAVSYFDLKKSSG